MSTAMDTEEPPAKRLATEAAEASSDDEDKAAEAEEAAARKRRCRAYAEWKPLIPYLYDWFSNDNRMWPSLSCRWGGVVDTLAHKTRQRAYFAEQTDGSMPNTLIVATMQVVNPRHAAAQHIAQFNEETRSPFVQKHKVLIHPGEVNKIREMSIKPSVVCTHTDSPDVYVWNTDSQADRAKDATRVGVAVESSVPDLTLTGHTDNASFALSTATGEWAVASGGSDNLVALWDLSDHQTTLSAKAPKASEMASGAGRRTTNSGTGGASSGTKLAARCLLKGHTADVEDVCFCPDDSRAVSSVGDDRLLAIWDTRTDGPPVASAKDAHTDDIHVVDWSPHDANMLVTGSADCLCKVWDRRNMTAAVRTYEMHDAPILRVQWVPDAPNYFSSGGEDARVCVWDTTKEDTRKVGDKVPEALMFQHNGHRSQVVDFHWNPYSPWTMLSVSTDDSMGGGSTMQMWRVSDLIHRPEEECIADIEGYRAIVEEGTANE